MAAGSRSVGSNIYTVLTFISLMSLIAGIAFVWVRSSQLFGSSNPFQLLS